MVPSTANHGCSPPIEAFSSHKSPHVSVLPTGARREGEETKVEHVLQVTEDQRIDTGQGMYSLTRLLVKRDISLCSGLARLHSSSFSESLINTHLTYAYILLTLTSAEFAHSFTHQDARPIHLQLSCITNQKHAAYPTFGCRFDRDRFWCQRSPNRPFLRASVPGLPQ
jgi:hypothetical protein